jgi:hypothetical protein
MHHTLAENSLALIKARIAEGDCPTTPPLSVEMLEELVVHFASPASQAAGEGAVVTLSRMGWEEQVEGGKLFTATAVFLSRHLGRLMSFGRARRSPSPSQQRGGRTMVDLNELIEQLRSNARPCDILEAADTIEALRTALSQEREAREKAEARILELSGMLGDTTIRHILEDRKSIEASLAEAKRLLEWRDMKGAPRDGTNILLRFPGPFSDPTETGISVGMWTGNGWWCRAIWAASSPHAEPTQWCPLPALFLSQEPNQ